MLFNNSNFFTDINYFCYWLGVAEISTLEVDIICFIPEVFFGTCLVIHILSIGCLKSDRYNLCFKNFFYFNLLASQFLTVLAFVALYFFVFVNNLSCSFECWGGLFKFSLDILLIRLVFVIIFSFFSLVFFSPFFFNKTNRSEFFFLINVSSFVLLLLFSTNDFLTFFILIESYALTIIANGATKAHSSSIIATLRFFSINLFSSVLFIFAISLLYGLLETTKFSSIALINSRLLFSGTYSPNSFLLVLSIIVIIVVLMMKLAAPPFHLMYSEFLSLISLDLCAFVLLISKIPLLFIFVLIVNLFSAHFLIIQYLLILGAVISILVGGSMLYTQKNLIKFLVYSSISSNGFILIGLILLGYSFHVSNIFIFYFFSFFSATLVFFLSILVFKYLCFIIFSSNRFLLNYFFFISDSRECEQVEDFSVLDFFFISFSVFSRFGSFKKVGPAFNNTVSASFIFFLIQNIGLPPFILFFSKILFLREIFINFSFFLFFFLFFLLSGLFLSFVNFKFLVELNITSRHSQFSKIFLFLPARTLAFSLSNFFINNGGTFNFILYLFSTLSYNNSSKDIFFSIYLNLIYFVLCFQLISVLSFFL